ncbi:hypothetical protein TNCV_2015261 [Trichonephila clavipes]|nr:hypothetical protein TNCV_2015261 [Trichonephila clavipes]
MTGFSLTQPLFGNSCQKSYGWAVNRHVPPSHSTEFMSFSPYNSSPSITDWKEHGLEHGTLRLDPTYHWFFRGEVQSGR